MENRELEFIEFTKNCGECGRRFKTKFNILEVSENRAGNVIITPELKNLISFWFPKNSVCCKKCSEKDWNEEREKELNKKEKKK